MSNLSIENLSRAVQTGDTQSFMTGNASSPAELATAREMQANGMEVGTQAPSDSKEAASTFSNLLHNSIAQVNEYQQDADTAIKNLVAGRTKNIHETMLAVERADTSLKLMMQVRNKILEAYREVMRMQV